jgi:ATP-dependent DNA ligase
MEAEQVDQIPVGSKSQYEPKWDGFRCLIFRRDNDVFLQSKAGQPLGRYFPEIVRVVQSVKPKWWVLDGELAVPMGPTFSFDHLLQRVHPAASRVAKLAKETPAIYIAFDLLMAGKRRSCAIHGYRNVAASLTSFRAISKRLIDSICRQSPSKPSRSKLG